MTTFARTDRRFLAMWWWTVDRPLLGAIAILGLVGVVLVFAAGPAVAARTGFPTFHFLVRHVVFLLPAAALLVSASMLSHRGVRAAGHAVLALGLVLMVLSLLVGPEIKGAHRWLVVGGLQLQPSEFVKPALAVVTAAWLASRPGLQGAWVPMSLAALTVGFLLLQPDAGMAVLVAAVLGMQLFLAGLPWFVLLGLTAAAGLTAWQAYVWLPHVAVRIDAFLDPDAIPYQVHWALEAITGGGLFGRGPGEGSAKFNLPDAHSDFIFAVAVEEFGLIACMALIALFGFVLLRALWRARGTTGRFAMLGVAGLIGGFGLQAFVNIGVNLQILPTKGMTLPLVSYGGSSLCATALGLGFALALLRPADEPIEHAA